MTRELVALAVTGVVLLALVAFAQPSAAVLVSVDGPEHVAAGDVATFHASVNARGVEQLRLSRVTLQVSSANGTRSSVALAPNGSVLNATTNGRGTVNVTRLVQSLRVDAPSDTGSGYGYGGGETGRYAFSIAAAAFDPGTYQLRVRVTTTDGRTFESNATTFTVDRPVGDTATVRGEGWT